jgi:hypothetical protein
MIEIVLEYQKLRGSIGLLIEKSGYKNAFLAEKIGIPASNFSVKKQRASWTEHEITAILQIIENEEIEDYYLGKIMENRLENEEFVSMEEFKRQFA